LPVVDDDGGLDTAQGVVALQDVVTADRLEPMISYRKPAPIFPETVPVLIALRTLQDERQQLAFVVDEFGGIEGIVTVEDLIEELVGEIYDEYDRDVASVIDEGGGRFVISGRFPVHDLVDLEIEVPDGEYTTVGGLVLDAFGRVPEPGERVEVPGWNLTVLEVEANAVAAVRFVAVDEGEA
jgi:putative hemolysin